MRSLNHYLILYKMNMKKIVTVIFLLTGIQALYAYPITPRPLRKLITESQYIIYARVIDVYAVTNQNSFTDHKAILAVEELYQGDKLNDTIDVYFSRAMTCPMPAVYEKGTRVLAFLDRGKGKNAYQTHALSYGSKELTLEALTAYKLRIKEMQQIHTINDSAEKNKKIIDWLVCCAIDSDTRWEGVYELSPGTGFLSYYDRGKDTLISIHALSGAQHAALRKAAFEIKSFSYADMDLIDLVEKKNDTELLQFLIDHLKKADDQFLGNEREVMQKITWMTKRCDLENVMTKINAIYYSDKNYDEKINTFSKEFVDLL